MQKEVIISALVGITLGLIVTYGLYQVKKSITTPPTSEVALQVTPQPEQNKGGLRINTPIDGLIQAKGKVELSGKTAKPNQFVVVFVGNDDTILKSDQTGQFKTEFNLNEGEHIITVISVDQNGQTQKQERLVVISDLFTPSQAPATTTTETTNKSATEDAKEATTQAILNRINKKLTNEEQTQLDKTIEQLAIKRGALVGQVERVTPESITITTTQGTVILPIDQEVVISQAKKTIDLNQVNVGNWLLVMGVTDGTRITPEYIFVSKTSLRPKPHLVVLGTLSQIHQSDLLIISRADSQTTQFQFNRTTKFENKDAKKAKLNQFSTDLAVLAVGYQEETKNKTSQVLTTLRALAAFTSKAN